MAVKTELLSAIIFVDMGANPGESQFTKLRTHIAANNYADERISTNMMWTHHLHRKESGQKLVVSKTDY